MMLTLYSLTDLPLLSVDVVYSIENKLWPGMHCNLQRIISCENKRIQILWVERDLVGSRKNSEDLEQATSGPTITLLVAHPVAG